MTQCCKCGAFLRPTPDLAWPTNISISFTQLRPHPNCPNAVNFQLIFSWHSCLYIMKMPSTFAFSVYLCFLSREIARFRSGMPKIDPLRPTVGGVGGENWPTTLPDATRPAPAHLQHCFQLLAVSPSNCNLVKTHQRSLLMQIIIR